MLEALRKGAGGIIAKFFIGILALSFAVWGISDVFTARRSNALAVVGDEKIFEQQYQAEFQRELRALGQRLGRRLSLEQARQLGVDRRVLSSLISQAALDNEITTLKLALSDKSVADSIVNNPAFHNAQGQFDKARFQQLLSSNGFSEATFVALERRTKLRNQLADVVEGNVAVPQAMTKAIYRQRYETRKAEYFLLPVSSVPTLADPSEGELKKYYDANKSGFTAPEYRSVTMLKLEPVDMADTITIADAALRKAYEEREAEFTTAEKRTIEQIPFKSRAEAEAAHKRLGEGLDFMALAKERSLKEIDVALGALKRKDIPDAKLAEVIFSLKKNEISRPVVGDLSITLVRVVKIVPEVKKSFDEVKSKLKKTIALERAQEEVLNLHDTVEDERAGGASLKEIADKLNLKLVTIDAIDASGKDAGGKSIANLPKGAGLLTLIFRTGVGVENDPADTQREGFIWFDVTKIIPRAVRPFDTVRAKAAEEWKRQKQREQLAAKGSELVDAIEKGANLAAQAAVLGQEVKTTKALKRRDSDAVFGPAAVAGLFLTPKGDVIQAPARKGGIIVLRVTEVTPPIFAPGSKEVTAIKKQLSAVMSRDLIQQFVTGVQTEAGVSINEPLWRRLRGQGS